MQYEAMSRASWWPVVSHFLTHFFVKKTEKPPILGGDLFLMPFAGPAKTLHLSVAYSLARQWEFHGTGPRWLGHLFEVLVLKWAGIFIGTKAVENKEDGTWECNVQIGQVTEMFSYFVLSPTLPLLILRSFKTVVPAVTMPCGCNCGRWRTARDRGYQIPTLCR